MSVFAHAPHDHGQHAESEHAKRGQVEYFVDQNDAALLVEAVEAQQFASVQEHAIYFHVESEYRVADVY